MLNFEKKYDRWNLERIGRHVLYWLAWAVFYATVNSMYKEDSFMHWVGIEFIFMTVKLPFAYFVIYFLVPNFLIQKKYTTFFLVALLSAIIGGIGIWTLDYYVIFPESTQKWYPNFWTIKMCYKTLDLIYIASLPTIIKLLQRHMQQEKLTLQIAEQKLGAELKLLKTQLQPHFLFNTLNNLYGMVLTQHPKAGEVVLGLSEMMSYMLYECERNRIALDKEIANLKNYIELEKIRYGKRLDISFDISGPTSTHTIAPLLFIPFVENAFKHGVEPTAAKCWIRINLWLNDDELQFLIENSLPEEKEVVTQSKNNSNGIGLVNVQKRLELLYPNKHQLEIKQEETHFVQLKLKLEDEMSDR